MRFYHGKQRHKQKLFLSTTISVIVIVTWRENNLLHIFLMYVTFFVDNCTPENLLRLFQEALNVHSANVHFDF